MVVIDTLKGCIKNDPTQSYNAPVSPIFLMKAIILAGGEGKRLRPITDYVPKPLVPINNIPILEWQIRYLKKFKVSEIIVCTGYKTSMIENYLKVKKLGVKITFSREKTMLGTGGAIKKAAKQIKEKSFFVINGDVITDIDLRKIAEIPDSIAVIELRTKYGIIETDGVKATKFLEKKEISDLWMNAGIYHLSSKTINDLPKKGDIEKTVFPDYAKEGKLNMVKFRNVSWHSIDSFKDIEECAVVIDEIIK